MLESELEPGQLLLLLLEPLDLRSAMVLQQSLGQPVQLGLERLQRGGGGSERAGGGEGRTAAAAWPWGRG